MDYQYGNLPVGYGITSFIDRDLLPEEGPLSETEKEHLILKYKDAESEKERERIREALAETGDVQNLFAGPSIG